MEYYKKKHIENQNFNINTILVSLIIKIKELKYYSITLMNTFAKLLILILDFINFL